MNRPPCPEVDCLHLSPEERRIAELTARVAELEAESAKHDDCARQAFADGFAAAKERAARLLDKPPRAIWTVQEAATAIRALSPERSKPDTWPMDICSRCGMAREDHGFRAPACDVFTQEWPPAECGARHPDSNEKCLVTAPHELHRAWDEAHGSQHWSAASDSRGGGR